MTSVNKFPSPPRTDALLVLSSCINCTAVSGTCGGRGVAIFCIVIKRCMRLLVYLGSCIYPGCYCFLSFHTPDKCSKLAYMRRHVAWNLLVPFSSPPPVYVLFSYVFVVAVRFSSLTVDMADSNHL